MHFDLFYEISMPPFLERSEAQAFEEVMGEVELADQLGYRAAWFVEHHFMRHYSHCSKPDLVLAALSQRTRNIRLGLGIIPLPLHHPVHVAERLGTLDILSGGRIEVGIGRGFSPAEYAVFGREMGESRSTVNEALDILRLSFGGQPVSYRGSQFQLDHVDILPQVVQRPHPPMWSAAVSPDSFPWVAGQGMGMLAGPFKPWLMTKHDIKNYLAAWNGNSPANVGMTVGIVCLPDREQAKKVAKQALTWFYNELYKTTLPVLEKLYPSYEHFHELGKFREVMKLGINLTLLETFGMAVVGNPADCIRQLRKYEKAGVTHMLLAVGAGATETEIVRESLRCIAEEVMPAFQGVD
jgi:alkanesulfonate monooxygenase SsuD/methylene tetrahydromethanopterin reductase-like flavin-dependent oxidoreductase (luciferase family)